MLKSHEDPPHFIFDCHRYVEQRRFFIDRIIAEEFCAFFINVGKKYASDIPNAKHKPSHYMSNTNKNKAIRDGKYLARHMPVLGNVHPIKIENIDIFFVTSFLCSLELLYY